MDLRSPYPYWLLRHGIINTYPSLQENIKSDVVIIGAGISGALVAWELTMAGHRVVIVDRRHAGTGSTAASTALLQYEIDTPLHQLIKKVGQDHAIRSYQLCRDAIYDLQKICKKLKDDKLLTLKPSLQFASFDSHVKNLEKEYELRVEAGFDLQWMEQRELRSVFGFRKPAAILSKDGAEADAYRITHLLLKECIDLGAEVYDNTEITQINHQKNGVELLTSTKCRIKAKKLVIACGYESQKYIPKKVQELQSTFAIVSEPFGTKDFWHKNALIWETRTPYLYLRTTDDSRILIGGKDVEFSDPLYRDQILSRKAKDLERSFADLFPKISFKTDFKWAGVFASTKDGLPYIGSIPERPHTYFALGFGGNGITFSVIAARMIKQMIGGKKDDDAPVFSFNR
ncbi:FAD-binding oxidoreductase [Terrimonas sp. NA20]|uniref:FAD-binding oxidoreductase n=1 Tax=Terrimonas ginsenosidimutans TaxID=2908004 RepID=A0ABS9KXR7_9BACT|nr:FAD-dependent oxidoreductase [Terrimonas ginsenosidimutans]MCG2617167.1 FAD-binding oxidoreductase [Terrimonas ginsenosidimutans]